MPRHLLVHLLLASVAVNDVTAFQSNLALRKTVRSPKPSLADGRGLQMVSEPRPPARSLRRSSLSKEVARANVVAQLPALKTAKSTVAKLAAIPGLDSVLLLLCAVVSMSLANMGGLAPGWLAFWDKTLGPAMGHHHLSVRGWVNEGLMAMFFFVVGLEIKIELVAGSLSSLRKAALPCIAALGGMVVPMLVYAVWNLMTPGGSMTGVVVPMATDIAFAMGVYSFFKRSMPASVGAFLLALATVDDLGAILVIATCFTSTLSWPFLAASVGLCGLLNKFRTTGYSNMKAFAAAGLGLWYSLLRGGITADIAGVIVAMMVPLKRKAKEASPAPVDPPPPAEKEEAPLLEELAHKLAPYSTWFIMPVFALANTAVNLALPTGLGFSKTAALLCNSVAQAPVAMGIAMGLIVGKPIGIFLWSWLAVKMNIASMPTGMSKRHLGVVGLLGGVGFTMCIFLIEMSLGASLQGLAKLAVLGASTAAAVFASAIMMAVPMQPKKLQPKLA